MASDDRRARRRRLIKLLAIPALLLLLLALNIEDWGRDFTAREAEIRADAPSSDLRPVYSTRPVDQLVEAAKWAAVRIGSWEYIGTEADGDTTRVVFLRTTRILRFKDDIRIRIVDLGDRRLVAGVSRSRSSLGDLGRNPRNLRQFLRQFDAVLDNAAENPAPFGRNAW